MQDMIPFLNNRDAYIGRIMFNPLIPLHHLLPLKLKFLPESYVLKEGNDIKGLITIAPSKCPLKRMEIQRLFFEEHCYEAAKELVQFVISKYKAKGVFSFIVRVDDNLPELLKLFVTACGFSQISYEKLWEIPTNQQDYTGTFKNIRSFRNSDSTTIASMYNESLLPHIRPLLSKDAGEFKEMIFRGLSYFSEYRYIIQNENSKNILAYISIKTSDNENYVLDIIQASWEEIDLSNIIAFVTRQIKKRQKLFNLFFKTKKYTQLGPKYEQYFVEHQIACVQNQIVLTNSTAKIIKENVSNKKFTILNQFYENSVNVPGKTFT